MILCNTVDNRHKFLNLFVGNRNLHTLSAKHVGWANQNRIAQTVCHFLSLRSRVDCAACGAGNLGLFQNLVKELPVLGSIHILRLSA